MRTKISQQILTAFNAVPGLDGILHGLRKIQMGKHGSRSSLFFSAKNQALIPVESRLELAFCYQLEADQTVLKYRTQALAIPFGCHSLYPDFLILSCHGCPFVREVKSSAFVDSNRNAAKAAYLATSLGEIGLEFGVITERDFWSGQEKINRIMAYNRGSRHCPPEPLYDAIVKIVERMAPENRTAEKIRAALIQQSLPHYLLEAAIFSGKLCCDMRLPITAQTRVGVSS